MGVLKRVLPALLVMLALPPGQCATGHTNPAEFQSAAAGANFQFVTDFDLLAPGSPASDCGMFNVAAFGFDAANERVDLAPAACGRYTPLSPPNALGPLDGLQFLGGNGDTITYTFSRPVKAFGVHLIGNPSPTGDPAIPFWKMRVNSGGGFEAQSATAPLHTLGSGNDHYFLGVVSQDEPFDEVILYSDNDPAACYSFNVDDITVAADVPESSITEAKNMPDGEILLASLAVTRLHEADGRFNVEAADRATGIAVTGASASRGETVSVYGTTSVTADGEVVLNAMHVMRRAPLPTPYPLCMGTLSVGGESQIGAQIGCHQAIGPNNIGLDIRTWGHVTAIAPDGSWMTISDASVRDSGMGSRGVRIVPAFPLSGFYVGGSVVVTGSSSVFKSGGLAFPQVRVAEPEDIINVNPL